LDEIGLQPAEFNGVDVGRLHQLASWMWRTVEASGPFRFPIEGPMMSDKSPRKSMSKKSGKSLKEKRADKKAKSSEHTVIETAFHAKKR
jgi:hypothetical protein